MRRLAVLPLALIVGMLILAPNPALAATGYYAESSSGGGVGACNVVSISEFRAGYTRGIGGTAFIDLSMSDTCGGNTGVSTVAFGHLGPGDMTGNKHVVRVTGTLYDENGSGTVVELGMIFRCWYVDPEDDSYCLATLSGYITVNGIRVRLDPSTDTLISVS